MGRMREKTMSLDVSRHGLFVLTRAKLEERQLLQLVITLPDGKLTATAVVSHKKAHGAEPGVGMQLFALSSMAKLWWDRLLFRLDGHASEPAPTSASGPDVATFLIKLRNVDRLLEFYDQNVKTRSLYLTTPVLREQGAPVALNIIHPDSEAEFVLDGRVASVCMETPKGMEIQLDRMPDATMAAFREFVTTGLLPSAPAKPADDPAVAKAPKPEDVADIVTEDFASEDISIDIEVDETSLEDSAQFFWNDVTDDDMVIDFDVSGFSEVKTGSTSTDITADVDEILAAPRRDMLVAVRCDGCGAEYGTVRVGSARGVLGELASHQPYWWPKEKKLVSILRLEPSDMRTKRREKLGEVGLERNMSLRLGFKIADMAGPPRCPDGSSARVTPIVRALKKALAELETPRKQTLQKAKCTACHERTLVVERWD